MKISKTRLKEIIKEELQETIGDRSLATAVRNNDFRRAEEKEGKSRLQLAQPISIGLIQTRPMKKVLWR